jgi:predicted phage tail protein
MTPEERRAGFKRLGLLTLGLVGAAGLLALVFAGMGAAGQAALAAGCGVVGIALVLGGVVAFGRTGPVRRTAGVYQRASVEQRKEAERMALGLFAFGITFSVLALVLG